MADFLTERFCIETRQDLTLELQKAENEQKFDTKEMLGALELTREFEGKVNFRFTEMDLQNISGGISNLATFECIPKDSKYYKIISSCFDQHLWHYVDMEDKVLSQKMEGYRQDLHENEDLVLSSSIDLFMFYRQTLTNCLKLSNQKPFLDLIKMYQKWLDIYQSLLISILPKEGKIVTESDIHLTCIIINTSDYCGTTTGQLEERVTEMIDKGFTSLVGFQTEIDSFTSCSAAGIQCLVRLMETSLEPCLQNMTKRPWGTITSVGDQSEYITQMAGIIKTTILQIRKLFSGGKFLKIFCDKFTESFTTKFMANIFRCKPLCETGTEQMLLDMHSLKNILVEMTMIGDEDRKQPSSAYLKILNKNISKIEQLLKVVLRPPEPPELIVETYNLLYGDYDVNMMLRILDLKGLKRAEIQPVIDLFQQKIPPNHVPSPSQSAIDSGNYKNNFKFMGMKRT